MKQCNRCRKTIAIRHANDYVSAWRFFYCKKTDYAQKRANFLQSVHNIGIIIRLNIVLKPECPSGAAKL